MRILNSKWVPFHAAVVLDQTFHTNSILAHFNGYLLYLHGSNFYDFLLKICSPYFFSDNVGQKSMARSIYPVIFMSEMSRMCFYYKRRKFISNSCCAKPSFVLRWICIDIFRKFKFQKWKIKFQWQKIKFQRWILQKDIQIWEQQHY